MAATETTGTAWHTRADDLATWALERFFVRTDRYGGYVDDDENGKFEEGVFEKRNLPRNGARKNALSRAVVMRHFRARTGTDVIGYHQLTAGAESFGRVASADIDCHEDETPSPELLERNRRYAEHIHHKLALLGFHPLTTSCGGGSYHVEPILNRNIPGKDLEAFGKWIVSDASEFDFDEPVESFPKQSSVPEDGFGNWLRLVGARPGKPLVWAQVFDGTNWHEGEAAVAHVLSLTGDSPDLIPAAAAPAKENPKPSSNGKPNYRARGFEDRDVFEEYNAAITLKEVVSWHEDKGHTLVSQKSDKAVFTRAGKKSGESFNVKVIKGVVITFNFSTSADLPAGKGMNPAQVRAFYEYGSYDTPAMAKLAVALKDELGWPKQPTVTINFDHATTNGKPDGKATKYPFGELTLIRGTARRTPTGKLSVEMKLCRGAEEIIAFNLTQTLSSWKATAARVAGVAALPEVPADADKSFAAALRDAAKSLENQTAPEGPTVRDIVGERVRAMLNVSHRTAKGKLYSETEKRELSRADFLALTTNDLLDDAAAGVDAPAVRNSLLRSVKDEMELLWADLLRAASPASEIDTDTPERRAFRDAVFRTWKTMRTWEVGQDAVDRTTASRASLAGMVQRQANPYLEGALVPMGREKWREVRKDVDCWWRPATLEGEIVVLLAMKWAAADQVGVSFPADVDRDSFKQFGISYGAFDANVPVSERSSDGSRLSVLTPALSAEILATADDDEPTEAENVSADAKDAH